jgi:hypothetical protein
MGIAKLFRHSRFSGDGYEMEAKLSCMRLGSSNAGRAITATAHKIARILYHVLKTKEPYSETIFHHCDEQAQLRAGVRLRKRVESRCDNPHAL